jgi:hypothetical protein
MTETTLTGLIKQDVCYTISVNQQACANIYKKSGMHPAIRRIPDFL